MEQEESNSLDMNFQNDPMYKQLENSLRIIYGYNDVYIKHYSRSYWYVPYIGPETRSQNDVHHFIRFANKVINDYPESQIFKLGLGSLKKFEENEEYKHPLTLMIWLTDVDDINDKASKVSNLISAKPSKSCIVF